jgi:hypothetical protein
MRAAVTNHKYQTGLNSRLLGYVQLRVGERLYALPVQGVHFDRDSGTRPGGFFDEEGELGILVDVEASEVDVQAQIESASVEAVRHISKKFLN